MGDKKKVSTSYLKYSGLAFQMVFIMAGGWWLGSFGDRYFEFPKPYLSILVALVFLIGLFVKLYRDIIQGKM